MSKLNTIQAAIIDALTGHAEPETSYAIGKAIGKSERITENALDTLIGLGLVRRARGSARIGQTLKYEIVR